MDSDVRVGHGRCCQNCLFNSSFGFFSRSELHGKDEEPHRKV
jgi:hypothetical protein